MAGSAEHLSSDLHAGVFAASENRSVPRSGRAGSRVLRWSWSCLLVSEGTEPLWLIVALHIAGLFWIGMLCHTELARARPAVHHLTKFYLCIAIGGALGGFFNAIIAPALFNDVWEYPIALVLACLVRQRRSLAAGDAKLTRLDWLLPIGLACATLIAITLVERSGMPAGPASAAMIFGVPVIVCYTFLARPVRFALGVAALLIAATFYHGAHGASQKRVRSFFGVHRITLDRENRYRLLVHGNTEHGRQSLDARRKSEPLAYYHRSGPVGDIFRALRSSRRRRALPLLASARARSRPMLVAANAGRFTKSTVRSCASRVIRAASAISPMRWSAARN